MIGPETALYYISIDAMYPAFNKRWDRLYPTLGPEGKFQIDLARYFKKNRFISRKGDWPTPWNLQIIPGFEMPEYDPSFKLSFSEICDRRASALRALINKTGARVVIYYSGGIDSTTCLVSILKNFSAEELSFIDVAMSAESIVENPRFFEKHILGKLNIVDSHKLKYSDIQKSGNYAVTSDQGDSIFGTELGTQMYYSYHQILSNLSLASQNKLKNYHLKVSDEKTHFSEYADMIIAYFELKRTPGFGKAFYEKFLHNIRTSNVPVHSLHDFFWWYIFNLKYMECALRSALYYYNGDNREKAINNTIFNWFHSEDYQKWSMVNNNNGQKIRGITASSYKWSAREYIHAYDKNDWYFKYKLKVSSFKNIVLRHEDYLNSPHIFAMDNHYNIYDLRDADVNRFLEKTLIDFR